VVTSQASARVEAKAPPSVAAAGTAPASSRDATPVKEPAAAPVAARSPASGPGAKPEPGAQTKGPSGGVQAGGRVVTPPAPSKAAPATGVPAGGTVSEEVGVDLEVMRRQLDERVKLLRQRAQESAEQLRKMRATMGEIDSDSPAK
jgi:hypothetical protein